MPLQQKRKRKDEQERDRGAWNLPSPPFEESPSQLSAEGAGIPFAPRAELVEELQKRLDGLELDRIAWPAPPPDSDELRVVADDEWPAGAA